MIVADTNIIAYLYLPTPFSDAVSRLYQKDPFWVAPVLWKSEFRNVLTFYLRKGAITFEQALALQEEAESMMAEHEFEISSPQVLALTNTGSCSAYDCEFIALAKQLDVKLITQDKKVLSEFPAVALSIEEYLHTNRP